MNHSQPVVVVRGKIAVSTEDFAVDVHFQGIVREVKLDASMKLDEAFVGVLHAKPKVIEQLPEGDAHRSKGGTRIALSRTVTDRVLSDIFASDLNKR